MTTYRHDPQEVLDYQFDWTTLLAASETVSTFSVTAAAGLTLASPDPSEAGGVITYWVSTGTVGVRYSVVCHITTSAGRQYEHTDHILIANS